MLLIVAIILVVLLASMTTYEHMTNKDVLTALKGFGVEDQPEKTGPKTAPIYGPKTTEVVEPEPTPNEEGDDDSGRKYPDIFGPDVVASPGTKNLKYSEDGDNDYNIDLKNAFPTDGPPQPFLTNFSNFQS